MPDTRAVTPDQETEATAGREEAAVATCSFCRKPNNAVAKMVAGPGVFICNECVDLCVQLMAADHKPSEMPRVAPWDQMTEVGDVLENLPRVAATAALVEETLTSWVRRARALGATWAKIGEALGMTRQSAWERFSGEE
jgi:hypothetical protein